MFKIHKWMGVVYQNQMLFSSSSIPSHTYTLLLTTHKSLFSQGPEVNASCVCVCIYTHIKRDVLFDKFATGGTDAADGQKIPNSTNTLFYFLFKKKKIKFQETVGHFLSDQSTPTPT